MNLFVKEDAEINFSIFVGLNKDNGILANLEKELLLKTDGLVSKEDEIKEFTFTFSKPSYRSDVDIMSNCCRQTFTNSGGELSFDPALLRYLRIVQLAKKWSITDDEGNSIPFTQKNLDRLNSTIAGLLADGLDKNINKA